MAHVNDRDKTIDDAIASEERDLLRSIGEEPGDLDQALGVFRGRLGWVNGVLMVAQGVLFLAGVYAAWRFFGAADALTALRWGLPSTVLLLASLSIKLALWPVIHVNRLMVALKRIELRMTSGIGQR